MKNAIKVMGVTLTILAFSGMSFAQAKPATPATPAAPAKAEKATTSRITGEVTSVDAKTGMLTVKSKNKEVSLTVESKAKSALEKIKVGDMVNVSYTEKEGKMIASSVKAEVKPREKAAKTQDRKAK